MKKQERMKQYKRLIAEAQALFLQRNGEYGDAFEECGVIGSVVEITSCSARLKQLVLHRLPLSETPSEAWQQMLRDKLRDTINYAVISLMLLEEHNWRGD